MSPFDVEEYLKQKRAVINLALERYLKHCRRYPEKLYRAMHYGVFPGGKRFRPILTLAAGEVFGGKQKCLLPFACALELIHAYSLIHDDLPALDDDDYRRGELANHKVFGEGIALLAGDALLTEAFHVISEARVLRLLKPTLVLELLHEITQAAGGGGMVGGQVVDLEAEDHEVDMATVENIHGRKTGALILAAARVGARIGGARPKEMQRITRYSRFLGLAFQITDDILDAESATCTAGRASKKKEEKKATYLSIAGPGAARDRVSNLLQRCLKEVELFGREADPLRGIVHTVASRVS
ncbi:MAG: polyprenyl synthetase family protein [Deltaproteobacteria bacterium]|nr:polyprenyl synthetase family protein [Deltaproteobacteria bacterium]